jgi:hypothetical protein
MKSSRWDPAEEIIKKNIKNMKSSRWDPAEEIIKNILLFVFGAISYVNI